MLKELIDDLYGMWDQIKREVRSKNPRLYEQWKAGGFIVDEDVLSMYPSLSKVAEELGLDEPEDEWEEDEDEDEDVEVWR